MKAEILSFFCASILLSVHAFSILTPKSVARVGLPIHRDFQTRPQSSTQLNLKVDESKILRDVINPSKFDGKAIFTTLAGQGLLLNAAFLIGNLVKIDVFHLESLETEAEILKETVLPALGITGSVLAAGILLQDVPILRQFFRERKFYVLRALGIQSTALQAAVIAAIISFGEAFSDELFFRGLCFSSIHQQFGDDIAIGFSSLIYGIAHYPIFGSNILVESFLGLIYGASFLSAKFNIVVPVIIHASYSLVSMYTTWYLATKDLRQRISTAEDNAKNSKEDDVSAKFEAIAKAVRLPSQMFT